MLSQLLHVLVLGPTVYGTGPFLCQSQFAVQLVPRKLVTVHEVRASNLLNLGNATLDKAGFVVAAALYVKLIETRT